MGTISEKLVYLNGTKQAIKNAINEDFEVIYDKGKNFFNYETITNVSGATNNSGIITTNNTDINIILRFNTISLEANTYYLSADIKRESGSGNFNKLNDGSIAWELVSSPVISNSYQRYVYKCSYTNTKNFDRILFQFTDTSSVYSIKNIMISTSSDTTYEPYVEETTFREYADEISSNNAKYKDLIPKETTNATNTLDISNSSGLDKALVTQYGNSYQEGEPTPDYPQEIVNISGKSTLKDVGKNLCGLKDQTITKAGVTFIIKDGVITANGTYTANTLTQFENEDNLVLDGNYTVKTFPISGSASTPPNFNVKNSGGITLANSVATSGSVVTFLVEKSSLICGIYAQKGTTFDNFKLKAQIEKGTTASEYDPYQEQSFDLDLPSGIELCKIDTYKDRIYPLNGKWYLEKKNKELVLTGTENWNYQSEHHRFIMNLSPRPVNGAMCYATTYIRGQTSSAGSNNTISVASGTGYSQLLIHDERFTTKNDYNNWLSNNNVEVYYPLETPTTEEITESNYPTLYNQLNNIKLYEGVNHITMTNESGLDVEFDIEYYKDWKLD